jgi:uncharacterized protein (TIGR04255 family)
MSMLPRRLRDDSVVEALLELRFSTNELSEIVVGKLAGMPSCAGMTTERLPIADLPVDFRRLDPNLRFSPTLVMRSSSTGRMVRLGDSVLSIHVLPKYPGWDAWKQELTQIIAEMFSILSSLKVTRMGLRYINAFTKERHLIKNVNDLSLRISVADQSIGDSININFKHSIDTDIHIITRIASPDFVVGVLPSSSSAVADIDVFTPEGFACSDPKIIDQWLEKAHTEEKQAFFKLIPNDVLAKLIEE